MDSLSHPLVRSAQRVTYLAAWEFLFAVRDLYQQQFSELESIAEPFLAGVDLNDEYASDPAYGEVFEAVRYWCQEHGIKSDAVESVAFEIALFRRAPQAPIGHYVHVGQPDPI